MGLLEALRDPQFRRDVGTNANQLAQSMSNTAASTVTAPVDALAWLLRKARVPVPQNPIGGSEWAMQQGLMADVPDGLPKVAGETLGLLAPMAGTQQGAAAVAKGLRQMGANAAAPSTLGKQAGAFKFPQDEALAAAQRNAAKPISEGGLGLRPNNTPMERAQAMGFTDNAFHGTSKDFASFDMNAAKGKTHGSGAFFTNNPHVASTYSGGVDNGSVIPVMLRTESPVTVNAKNQNWNWIGKNTEISAPKITVADKEGDKLMADLFGASEAATIERKAFNKKLGKLWPNEFKYDDVASTDDLARWANNQGYGSMIFDAVRDRGPSGIFANAQSALPSKNTVIFDPKNIRSRFAAFDPARRNEADLLGAADPRLLALLAAASGGAAYGSKDK